MWRSFFMFGVCACALIGCSRREEAVQQISAAQPLSPPVRLAAVYTALVENPNATNALLVGDAARTLTNALAHAHIHADVTPCGRYDLVFVSDTPITPERCAQACAHLAVEGVLAWMLSVADVSAQAFRQELEALSLSDVRLWMPAETHWLLTARRTGKPVGLGALLEVFSREDAFDDLAQLRCGTPSELFANYVGTREDIMPAFRTGDLSAKVRPAFFLTREIPALDWIDDEGVEPDIARTIRVEMRAAQNVRRMVVEGDLAAESARDKKQEEAATEKWARAYLRNPNDLFLLARIDRLNANARGFLEVGKVLQAMKCYETIIAICPRDAAALNNFGRCLKRIGRADLAKPVLQRSEELIRIQEKTSAK